MSIEHGNENGLVFTDNETLGMTTFEKMIMIIKNNDYNDYINLDWTTLSSFQLSEDFIEMNNGLLSWNVLSVQQTFTKSFIEKYFNKINFKALLNSKVNKDTCMAYPELMYAISLKKNEDPVLKKKKKNNETTIKINHSFEYIIMFMELYFKDDFNSLDWNNISRMRYLSDDFMEKYSDNLNWNSICTNQIMTEKFIKKFIEKINFNIISSTVSNLISINFLFEYRNELNLTKIKNYYQKTKKIQKCNYLNDLLHVDDYELFYNNYISYKTISGLIDDNLLYKNSNLIHPL